MYNKKNLITKKFLIIILFTLFSCNAFAETKPELEDFAEKYLKDFKDKFSYKYFKLVVDIDSSEIIIKKNYGTFKYKLEEYQINNGEMVIEKKFNKMYFQLINEEGNTVASFNYKIVFE